ncbi:MAG: hypothetical protein PVS2B1_22610 [Candidatus Dormibacteraceae bacterium]
MIEWDQIVNPLGIGVDDSAVGLNHSRLPCRRGVSFLLVHGEGLGNLGSDQTAERSPKTAKTGKGNLFTASEHGNEAIPLGLR